MAVTRQGPYRLSSLEHDGHGPVMLRMSEDVTIPAGAVVVLSPRTLPYGVPSLTIYTGVEPVLATTAATRAPSHG